MYGNRTHQITRVSMISDKRHFKEDIMRVKSEVFIMIQKSDQPEHTMFTT